MYISLGASQREMVEGFLVLFEVGSCRMSWRRPSRVVVFHRLILTKHSRCFGKDTKGADGAAGLLEALSQSTQLENLDFTDCSQIPTGAWQKLPDGAWPKLRDASGIPEEELQRLQLGAEGARVGHL